MRHFLKISLATLREDCKRVVCKGYVIWRVAWLLSFANVAVLVDFLGSIPIGLAGLLYLWLRRLAAQFPPFPADSELMKRRRIYAKRIWL